MNAYIEFNPDVFRDKVLLLPCDDPEWSNFTKFFAQNFERFGLKKMISTSYAPESKSIVNYQLTLFETSSPQFDEVKTRNNGKIFILERDANTNKKMNIDDLNWTYLEGDGDFRSKEVTRLRDEADIIITNPPFSLFTDFVHWLIEGKKKFIIIGNENTVSTKRIFPLIKDGKMWIGKNTGDMSFMVPEESEPKETRFWIDEDGQKWRSMGNICWFTNIDLGRRHEKLQLMSMSDNLRYNKPLNKVLENKFGVDYYPKYSNYDAIPDDYLGIMGVPVTFLKKHSPDQFRIIGHTHSADKTAEVEALRLDPKNRHRGFVGDKQIFERILIQKVVE